MITSVLAINLKRNVPSNEVPRSATLLTYNPLYLVIATLSTEWALQHNNQCIDSSTSLSILLPVIPKCNWRTLQVNTLSWYLSHVLDWDYITYEHREAGITSIWLYSGTLVYGHLTKITSPLTLRLPCCSIVNYIQYEKEQSDVSPLNNTVTSVLRSLLPIRKGNHNN